MIMVTEYVTMRLKMLAHLMAYTLGSDPNVVNLSPEC